MNIQLTEADVQNCTWTLEEVTPDYRRYVGRETHPVSGAPIVVRKTEYLAEDALLARNAEDVRGGAGQYFTPRPLIRAIAEVSGPGPTMHIADPACGTGGVLLAAFEYLLKSNPNLERKGQSVINQQASHLACDDGHKMAAIFPRHVRSC
jgi:type I restriction-modification system DNA methylase subunit